jgi:O-antigen/teichoic acid export membrane protein
MLLTQIDIFIVQHKFFWEQAGNYVAVSILAKFVFFLAGSIQTVYYPQLAKNKAHNVSRIQLRNYFLLLMLLILVSLWGAWLFWTYVLFLFKAHLVAYSWWLQPLIISSGALFFFTTIFKLLISRQEFSRAYLLIWVWILSMIRLHFAPSTLDSFVPLYMRTMIALCLWAAWCFLSVLGKKNTSN